VLECRHRQHAHLEDRIRDDKDTGLSKFPFKAFALNEVWLEIVMLAHDLIVWTQALCLDGELSKAEPKRLRYRLLHVAGRLAFSGRRAKLHLQNTWPGPVTCSPRSRSSKRSHQRPADPPATGLPNPADPPGPQPRGPLPANNASIATAGLPTRPVRRNTTQTGPQARQ
jgi:hypothetical protein